MKFLKHSEKVLLVIMIMLTLASVTISTYISINQTETNVKSCLNKNLYVIQSGGTVEENFTEKYNNLKNKIAPQKIISYSPRITASNMTPQDWNQITTDIADQYNNYDAFVIIGDPDTIPYIASALAFSLENLRKPVVITSEDLSNSLVLASAAEFQEVMVASGGKLIRGCRSIVNVGGKGFLSPNFPALTSKLTITPSDDEVFGVKLFKPDVKIAIVKMHPGVDLSNFKGVNGVILELWGEGSSPKFLKEIEILSKSGVVIVAVSHTTEEVDIRLLDAGVLSGHDMTTPAAYTKLSFLLSNVEDKKLIGQLMDISFRGEMTL